MAWLLDQPITLTLFGVPRQQINLIAATETKSVSGYVQEKLRHVVTDVLIRDNYFWRVYLYGHYISTCCPNYLKPRHLHSLQARVERVRTHDQTLSAFLTDNPGRYTHFVLLDHQDWLAHHNPRALTAEWQRILDNAERGTKILRRSAGQAIDFIPRFARNALRFFPDWTSRMQVHNRVGTYGTTHLAEVV